VSRLRTKLGSLFAFLLLALGSFPANAVSQPAITAAEEASESGALGGFPYSVEKLRTPHGDGLKIHIVSEGRDIIVKMIPGRESARLSYEESSHGEVVATARATLKEGRNYLTLHMPGLPAERIPLELVERHCGCDFLEGFFAGLCPSLPPGPLQDRCNLASGAALILCASVPWSVCNVVDEPPCIEYNGGYQPVVQAYPHSGGPGTQVHVEGAFFPRSASYKILFYPDNTTSLIKYELGSGYTDSRGSLSKVVTIPNIGDQGRANGIICVRTTARGIVEGSPFTYVSPMGEPS
jgi:hypothetical protein